MPDGIGAVVRDAVTLRIVWPDGVILDIPDLVAEPVESAQPVKVKPALAAKRTPAHHSQDDDSQLTTHLCRPFFPCVLVRAELDSR